MIVSDLEAPADAAAREALLDRVMGAARFTKTSARFRDRRRPAAGLSLIARDGDRIVGTVRLWHAAAMGGGEARPVLLLGAPAGDPSPPGGGLAPPPPQWPLPARRSVGNPLSSQPIG